MRVPDFRSVSVLVVGDVVADRWIRGEPSGVSMEAPALVLRHAGEGLLAGGAASLARHVRALGAEVSLLGVVGRDATGRELLNLLESEGVDTSGVELVPGAATATRTRVLAGGSAFAPRQVLRIDRGPREPYEAEVRARVAARAYALGEGFDAVVVADEDLGTAGPELGAVAAELARTGRIAVLDPGRSIDGFAGLSAIAIGFGDLGSEELDPRTWRTRAEEMLARASARFLLVERGQLGMALFGKELPGGGIAVESAASAGSESRLGLGSCSTGVFAAALAAGLSASEAMVLANAAAGVVASGGSNGVCDPPRLAGAAATAPAAVRLAAIER
jgi:rfaE bifunctional protein kinase chain/domain